MVANTQFFVPSRAVSHHFLMSFLSNALTVGSCSLFRFLLTSDGFTLMTDAAGGIDCVHFCSALHAGSLVSERLSLRDFLTPLARNRLVLNTIDRSLDSHGSSLTLHACRSHKTRTKLEQLAFTIIRLDGMNQLICASIEDPFESSLPWFVGPEHSTSPR